MERDEKGRFKKGTSGNKNGRSKVHPKIRDLAKKYSPAAFRKIVELMESEDQRISFSAAQEILNRALGKPAQAVTGEDGEGPVEVKVTVEFVDP